MGQDKTGRPVDTPFFTSLPGGMDLDQRQIIIGAGGIRGDMLAAEFSTIIKTVDYTTALVMIVLVNASATPVTVTLPVAANSKNKVYYIKKTDKSPNIVTIEGNGNDTIDDELNIQIYIPLTCITVSCDGTEWWII